MFQVEEVDDVSMSDSEDDDEDDMADEFVSRCPPPCRERSKCVVAS